MNLSELSKNFTQLTQNIETYLAKDLEERFPYIKAENAWFTLENVVLAFRGIQDYLKQENIEKWLKNYQIDFSKTAKKVGIVMAGNIPLVGFHDLLTVLVSGNIAVIKLSSQDTFLMKWLVTELFEINPELENRIQIVEKLNKVDAVIATGSNNTSRYFEYYFKDVPHIIRKNRNGIAIIRGDETEEDLKILAEDIFMYFGLGCRNIAKLYVPKDYNFDNFFKAIDYRKEVINHHKYNNNYEYNRAIFVLKKLYHFDNGFLLVREDKSLASPIACLHYEFYENNTQLNIEVKEKEAEIQCIVSHQGYFPQSFAFGESQQPQLWDYADGVDTLEFLLGLK